MHAFKLDNWGQIIHSKKLRKNNKRKNKPATVSEWSQNRNNPAAKLPAPITGSSLHGKGQFFLRDEVVSENDRSSVSNSLDSQIGRDIDELDSFRYSMLKQI